MFTLLANEPASMFTRGAVAAKILRRPCLQGYDRFAKGAHLPREGRILALVDYAVVAELVDAQR